MSGLRIKVCIKNIFKNIFHVLIILIILILITCPFASSIWDIIANQTAYLQEMLFSSVSYWVIPRSQFDYVYSVKYELYTCPYIHSHPLQSHNCRHNLTLCKTAFCKYVSRFNEGLENYERRWRTSVSYITWHTKFTHIPGRKIPDGFKRRAMISIDIESLIYISTIYCVRLYFLLYTTFSTIFYVWKRLNEILYKDRSCFNQ